MTAHIFHPAAVRDAQEINRHYTEISEDLSDRFWKELNEGIDEILDNPKGQHFDPSGFRRLNLTKFPYHIPYDVRSNTVRFMIVRHHHRHPSYSVRRR